MNKHYWVSGYSLSHDLSGWARNNRGMCEWVDINKNETKNSVCGKSPVCKQPDINVHSNCLPSQSSFFSPCGHCPPPPCSLSLSPHPPGTCWNKRETTVLNKPLSQSKLCYYSKLNRTQCQYLSNHCLCACQSELRKPHYFHNFCSISQIRSIWEWTQKLGRVAHRRRSHLFSQEAGSISMLCDRDKLWDWVSRLLEGELESELTPSLLWLP